MSIADTYESSLYVDPDFEVLCVKKALSFRDITVIRTLEIRRSYRALQEVCAAKKINYRYIAFANYAGAVEVILDQSKASDAFQ